MHKQRNSQLSLLYNQNVRALLKADNNEGENYIPTPCSKEIQFFSQAQGLKVAGSLQQMLYFLRIEAELK